MGHTGLVPLEYEAVRLSGCCRPPSCSASEEVQIGTVEVRRPAYSAPLSPEVH